MSQNDAQNCVNNCFVCGRQEDDLLKLEPELVQTLDAQVENVSCPCFVMVGDEDKTVDNRGAVDLVKKAGSRDMTIRRYPALHGLMGEPSPLVEQMQQTHHCKIS